MSIRCYQALLGPVLALLFASSAGAVEFTSGTRQASLVELFTSQGCNSCPPAEKYLNAFQHHAQLWKTYIPVAFHVDYWDYLGWQDRFAKPEHRVRQEAYARVNRQNTIYTPGFYVNGEPWRRGFLRRDPEPSDKAPGRLSVSLHADRLDARFDSVSQDDHPLVLNVVLLGMDLETDIKAGENAGRRSGHDFVVLYHQVAETNNRHWQLKLQKTTSTQTDRLAIAAWVTKVDDPRPLQAVGGYLSPN